VLEAEQQPAGRHVLREPEHRQGPRIERAHLTLQGRLMKELRLHGISTVAHAYTWAPSFTAAYDTRFMIREPG